MIDDKFRARIPSTMIDQLHAEEKQLLASKNWFSIPQIIKAYMEAQKKMHEVLSNRNKGLK